MAEQNRAYVQDDGPRARAREAGERPESDTGTTLIEIDAPHSIVQKCKMYKEYRRAKRWLARSGTSVRASRVGVHGSVSGASLQRVASRELGQVASDDLLHRHVSIETILSDATYVDDGFDLAGRGHGRVDESQVRARSSDARARLIVRAVALVKRVLQRGHVPAILELRSGRLEQTRTVASRTAHASGPRVPGRVARRPHERPLAAACVPPARERIHVPRDVVEHLEGA
jgi:hypothetical protein